MASVTTIDLSQEGTLVKTSNVRLPRVLTVAGSDSSGGAGIEADLKTITAHSCYALTCITSLTAQNSTGVLYVENTSEDVIKKLLEANFSDIEIDVIKTGLLSSQVLNILPTTLDKYHKGKPVVIDPVIFANSGDVFGKSSNVPGIIKLFQDRPKTLITPNFEEAEIIYNTIATSESEKTEFNSIESLAKLAKFISVNLKCESVLLKGGHIPFDEDDKLASKSGGKPVIVYNILYESVGDKMTVFKSDYINSGNTHGSGCSLASSIASNLATKKSVNDSVRLAVEYVHNGILTADTSFGHGVNGPINHMHKINSGIDVSSEVNDNVDPFALPFKDGEFLKYLITHPKIEPVWNQYINHPFVKNIAQMTLKREKFEEFLLQDYKYLINYGRIHALVATLAPDLDSLRSEAEIIIKVCNEMENHTEKIKKRWPSINLDEIQINDACKKYNDYLVKIAQETKDWLCINVALSPCLFGYHYAGKIAMEKYYDKEKNGTDNDYYHWLSDYVSEWYIQSCELGEAVLEKYKVGISESKLQLLVDIFADVCQLEVNFWDAVNEYE